MSESISAGMSEAQEFLRALTRHSRPLPPSVSAILAAVAMETGISVEDILGRSRKFTVARHEAIRRIRSSTKASTTMIGRWFGGRDHTTICHTLSPRPRPRPAPDLAKAPAWLTHALEMRKSGLSFRQIAAEIPPVRGSSEPSVRVWIQAVEAQPEMLEKFND